MRYDDLPMSVKLQIKERVKEDIDNLLWEHLPKHGALVADWSQLQYRLMIPGQENAANINVPLLQLKKSLMFLGIAILSDKEMEMLEKEIVNARVSDDDLLWYGTRWFSAADRSDRISFLIAKKSTILGVGSK